jgi:hypothetical protein
MSVLACSVISLSVSLVFAVQSGPNQPGRGPVPPPAGGAPTAAQHPAAPGGVQVRPPLLVQHLPDALACPAPDWIVPGTRITYFSSVAEIEDAAGAVNLVPDANGNITDSKGNRFREGSAVGLGVGGAGWDCVDVIAVEPGVIVLSLRQFPNQNGLQGPCTSSGSMTALSHPSGCDFFVHPNLLAQLTESSNEGVSVLKGTIEHRGTTYNAIRSTVEIPRTRLSSMYDLSSGVQLTHNSSTQFDKGTAFRESGNNYEGQRKTGRSLANNQFHGVRTLGIPWTTMEMPAWVRTMKVARYEGARVDSGTPEMGLGRLVTNMSVEFKTQHVGKTFATYEMTMVQQMQGLPAMEPFKSLSATGPGSIDGLWMHPNVLQQLEQGQLLDSDANTGVQVGVDYVGPGQNGQPVVVIASGNQTYKFSAMYDAGTGKLLGTNKMERSASTGGTITTQFQLVGME